MELNIPRSILNILNNCWVGHLIDLSLVDRLEEVYVNENAKKIKFNYLGDDMVLISGCTKEWFNESTKQEDLLSIFHSIQKKRLFKGVIWTDSIIVG